MPKYSGREREAKLIQRANRAAAVGRLMLGELESWDQFLEPDTIDLVSLPRRNLKSGLADVRTRLSQEINNFCSSNFVDMDEKKLSMLYEEIKAYRGLELPLSDFEERFSQVQRNVLIGSPSHATVHISLWGLKFWFPEDELTKDLVSALQVILDGNPKYIDFKEKSHTQLITDQPELVLLMRMRMFAIRSSILWCFNLIEAYLNGLAWDFIRHHGTEGLSKNKRELIEDTTSVSIRKKLMNYPRIITGKDLFKENDEELNAFVEVVKPYRDSLVHPSPFSAPDKFGGYDKLRLFYRIDIDTVVFTVDLLVRIIRRIHIHVFGNETAMPAWIIDLESKVNEISSHINL